MPKPLNSRSQLSACNLVPLVNAGLSKCLFACHSLTMYDVWTISVHDTDYPCGIMMAHYFHHLTMVNRQLFTVFANVYARYTNDNTNNNWNDYWLYGDAEKRRVLSSILQCIYPIANWLCIRYNYQLPFNLLLHNIAMVIEHINSLSRWIGPGSLPMEYPAISPSPSKSHFRTWNIRQPVEANLGHNQFRVNCA